MDKWRKPEESYNGGVGEEGKAWQLLESLTLHSLKEQKRARRWGIFFKLLTFTLMFAIVGLIYLSSKDVLPVSAPAGSHTALVNLRGPISDDGDASADNIVIGLRAAFKDKGTKAVMLRINSPGGSPVQSGYIYDEIVRLRKLYPDIPLYAVITDIGASGAYYVAAAADAIYADKASLVGSIGVVSSGFGYVDAMKKLGITRRTYTSGEHKAFMDPFLPRDKEAAKLWQASLETIHQQFIDSVKAGRGDRLKKNKDLFSGMIWSGEQAMDLGLIDGLGSAGFVARDIVGQADIVDFTPKITPLERFARNFGASAAHVMLQIMGGSGLQLK
ncbi:S49 family peptidase [Candidatus Sororendozoicomonas aggregata]|uniref:S49 family peptidase n=1 Tax=Candidatus Sororendozoicomonas aggregata TaxID=3073239 RepID=UPI002ED20443